MLGLIDSGVAQGAKLLLDGRIPPSPATSKATSFSPGLRGMTDQMDGIYQREIFGPVLQRGLRGHAGGCHRLHQPQPGSTSIFTNGWTRAQFNTTSTWGGWASTCLHPRYPWPTSASRARARASSLATWARTAKRAVPVLDRPDRHDPLVRDHGSNNDAVNTTMSKRSGVSAAIRLPRSCQRFAYSVF